MKIKAAFLALCLGSIASAAATRRGGRTCTFELSHLRTQVIDILTLLAAAKLT